MDNTKRIKLEELVVLIARQERRDRTVVAVAGAPGSGKSTLAESLVGKLNEQQVGSTAILPMDGFHFDDNVLRQLGLHARKGAPETFDVAGLLHTLNRLKRNQESSIAVPVFDRDLELARAGARLIPQSVRRVIVEGNYLLLGQEPWSRLHELFDITIMVDVPRHILRKRLNQRWLDYENLPAEVALKVEGNDLVNGELVAKNSVEAAFYLRQT